MLLGSRPFTSPGSLGEGSIEPVPNPGGTGPGPGQGSSLARAGAVRAEFDGGKDVALSTDFPGSADNAVL
ncbi:hypothetical protein ABIA35_005179 [Catenulispora sp. MAP12-49]|uniref:hypothetical protein n=1 Tax=Catenulispora sp. MAP12-49 TaxID=3156302 RepID=UPI00351284D2